MTLKELQDKINAIAEDDFFHSCDVVIGDTWKVASGVRGVSIGELPPAAYGISELALYITPTTELKKKEPPVKRPRRTFEEIIKDLKPFFWAYDKDADQGRRRDYEGTWMISPDGSLGYFGDDDDSASGSIEADELAAISAACTEIAANYQDEHGKEEK